MWQCGGLVLDVSRPLVMGIVNVTPDSFSDGGRFLEPQAAIAHANRLLEDGAGILDLGGESTRPGSAPVAADVQIARLLPVFEGLAGLGACLSVDTRSAEVARRMLEAGASIVNDVSALGDPAMPEVVAASGAGLVLMHMQGRPETMQAAPSYTDAAREVTDFLAARMEAAERSGIPVNRLALDPGIGFGKRLEHNLELIARLDEIAALGRPLVVGLSRKSFLGKLVDGAPTDQRLEAALAATAIAVFRGARVIRTHDVRATRNAVRVADAVARATRGVQEPT